MADILNTGISGLLASQQAIATTSHNISNANTEGYSRQRVTQGTQAPEVTRVGYVGQGVKITDIERIQNEYVQSRLEQTSSEQQRVEVYYEMLSRIDVMLAEDNSGLTEIQNDFFNAIQDLNTNPTSVGARQSVINAAANLTDRFNGVQNQFDALQRETNTRISTVVEDINSIAQNIANLNRQIVASSVTGKPNDLMDQRDKQLTDLSQLISIDTYHAPDGSMNVYIGNGFNLVTGTNIMELTQAPDESLPDMTQIVLESPNGNRVISEQLTGGALGGLMDFRREALDPAMNQLGRLAVVFADQFNQQHTQGLTLEGDPGGLFFDAPSIDPINDSDNTGTGSLNVSFVDTTQITISDYSVAYDGSEYTLTRLSDNTSVSGAIPLEMDGLRVEVTGTPDAGDKFLVFPTKKAARDFTSPLTDIQDIALSSPLRTESPVSNLGTGSISSPDIIDSSNANLQNSIEIRFNTPATSFDVVDVDAGATLASGITYNKGEAIEYQGWSVSITGEPDPGDVFLIETNANGTGNNRNGQLLANLQDALLIESSSSLQDGYGAFVGKIGSDTRQAQINSDAMDALLEEARASRESVSGVNLDEEAVNLTRHQQAYQASAQVIAAAESMFQTLMAAIQ